jgi:membrane associated rhomboid family serine protease
MMSSMHNIKQGRVYVISLPLPPLPRKDSCIGFRWTLVTSAFSHVRTDHLIFNMIGTSLLPFFPHLSPSPDCPFSPGLWMFCPSVAASVGSAVFLQVFLAGAIGCNLFSLFWNRNADERRTSVGASGGNISHQATRIY